MNGYRCKKLYYAWGTLELWQLYPYSDLHNDRTDGDLHNDKTYFDIDI